MAASGHFIFELFKIGILSFVYTIFIVGLPVVFLLLTGNKVVFNNKGISRLYQVVYVTLFVFSFTYYGNHGLGDESNIPLGHWETMHAGDSLPYFYCGRDQIGVKKYLLKDDILCATTYNGGLVCNLKTKQSRSFNSEAGYNAYAKRNDLPLANQLIEFEQQYDNYWSGWRFWVLP